MSEAIAHSEKAETATKPILSESQQQVLDRHRDGVQVNDKIVTSSPHLSIFSYATNIDKIVLAFGCLCCVIGGALNPLLTVIYGQLVGSFDNFTKGNIDGNELQSQVSRFSLYFVYLAIGMFVFIYLATLIVFVIGGRVTGRLRQDYLKAVLRQNMAFFDKLGTGQVTTTLTSDVHQIQEAVSGKVSLTLTGCASCIAALIITYVEYWKLALVLMGTVVAIGAANTLGVKLAVRKHRQARAAAAKGDSIAEEALLSHKHVAAFGIAEVMGERYDRQLNIAKSEALRARSVVALMTASFMGIMYLSSGLSFWEGSRLLVAGEMSASQIVTCSMAVIISALTIGKIAPNAQAFITGIAGASRLFESITRKSPEDPFEESGLKLNNVEGRINFKDVKLVYPSRPDTLALDGLSISVPAGKLTAIIGASGCGKSSIISLIERFYEPIEGSIELDGIDIQHLNLRWLRKNISLVSQEPVLFKTSIFENIRYGLISAVKQPSSEEEVRKLVLEAARIANAHDFIEALPQGYNTDVGQIGAEQLSGGQRQRIAIARAIVGDPKILLLDEATAALDTKSERLVLDALKRASAGRTTIFITHRLSSIRDADQIILMAAGRVVEAGTHDSLVLSGGLYSQAIEKHNLVSSVKPTSIDELNGSEISSVYVGKDATIGLKTEGEKLEKTKSPIIVVSKTHGSHHAENYSLWSLVKLASSLNRPELPLVLLGLMCCLLSGAASPVQSLFFANNIEALSLPASDYIELRSRVNFWASMYLMLGLVAFTTWAGQGACLAYCSEALTFRARSKGLRAMLSQDSAFYDRPGRTTGALTKILSTSATEIAGLSGAVLSTILTAVATLIGGIVLSLVIGWKLALVCTATIPIVMGTGWFRLRALAANEARVRAAYADSAGYAAEAITAIRTVAALGLEEHVLNTYADIIEKTADHTLRSTLYASALYAMSQSAIYLVAALGFWYGGTLISDHEYTMFQYFVCFAALVSGTQQVGSVFSFAPDISKAMHGGSDYRRLFEEKPSIDVNNDSGIKLQNVAGNIELRDVSFIYPNRPGAYALRNFSLTVKAKQHVALVGHSGCGKSTVISLLERFIDPTSGVVSVDTVDVRALNLKTYRSLVSLVGQDSVLYSGSIRDNLLLGVGRDVSENDLLLACQNANIDTFINSLPDGFNSEVGSRGVMLSGGQKQRLAIARALLRDSSILLLDEATSALDGEAEDVVQKALDAASRNRTTITVAHRLRTIRNADVIVVMEKGVVVEQGTHEDLIRLKGKYADMVQLQTLEETRQDLPTLDE